MLIQPVIWYVKGCLFSMRQFFIIEHQCCFTGIQDGTRSTVQEPIISQAIFLEKLNAINGKTHELVLLTGERGCGKTAWCLELIDQARHAGIHAVGLVSPGVFQNGIKTGIDLLDISSGERRRLAIKRAQISPQPELEVDTQNWCFDSQVLSWGNHILAQLPSSQLLILDELGPLEFLSGGGLTNGLSCIDGGIFQLACVVVRPELLSEALERWPWGQVISLSGQPVMGRQG